MRDRIGMQQGVAAISPVSLISVDGASTYPEVEAGALGAAPPADAATFTSMGKLSPHRISTFAPDCFTCTAQLHGVEPCRSTSTSAFFTATSFGS